MQVFYWTVLLFAVGVTVFAIQNSKAPIVTIAFLFWEFNASLVFTILGSIGLGVLMALLVWFPMTLRSSIRKKKPPKEPSPG